MPFGISFATGDLSDYTISVDIMRKALEITPNTDYLRYRIDRFRINLTKNTPSISQHK